jgi:hypothetical protein
VFLGVVVYTFHDINFTVIGYVWIGIWYFFAVFEMVYVKKVVDTVQMTTWSRTYYQVHPSQTIAPFKHISQSSVPTASNINTCICHDSCACLVRLTQ